MYAWDFMKQSCRFFKYVWNQIEKNILFRLLFQIQDIEMFPNYSLHLKNYWYFNSETDIFLTNKFTRWKIFSNRPDFKKLKILKGDNIYFTAREWEWASWESFKEK